jgi:hypothetical protein
MTEQLYKVLRQVTTGWELADDRAQNLTKQQCDEVLNNLVQMEGVNPRSLKAVNQNIEIPEQQ